MARKPNRGFRLHELRLYQGQRQTAMPFEADDRNYIDHLEEIVKSHLLNVRLDAKPRPDFFAHREGPDAGVEVEDDGEAEDPTSIFEIHELRREGRGRLWLTYRSGSIGAYRWAVPRGTDIPVDVSQHAVTNEQRACFLAPSAPGTVGLLIAESAGRATGEHALRAWLHAASKATMGQDPHWRLKYTPVADPAHVRELVNEDDVQEVVLMRREETPERNTQADPFTIRAPLITQRSRSAAVQRVLGWFERRDDPLTPRQGARELAAIIDRRFENVDFDDGYVKVKGSYDAGQQLRPDLAKDIFTYRLGAGWASEGFVLRRAQGVAENIHGVSNLELPWD